MDKKQLRQICLENRKNLSLQQKQSFSHSICEKLFNIVKPSNIMSYMPYNNEVLIDEFNIHFNVFYPVIENNLKMNAYRTNSNDYIKNKYSILEPNVNNSATINPKDLNYVIVPIVGFDENMNRLGYGKGYYDRYLIKCINAIKIGVAYEVQKLSQIETNDFDVKLDYIITETNIYQK